MEHFIDFLYPFDRRVLCPIHGLGKDFRFSCMDKVVVAEALGFESCLAGEVWTVVAHPFVSVEEVEAFPWRTFAEGDEGRNEVDGFSRYAADSDIPCGGGTFGPFTVAALILWTEYCCRSIRKRPEVVHAVMRKVTDFMIELAREEAKAGAPFSGLPSRRHR